MRVQKKKKESFLQKKIIEVEFKNNKK